MATLKSALGLFLVDSAGKGFMGTSSIVYVSIPDTASSTCGDLGLPTLPTSTGWTYRCSTSASSSLTDGTGWLPVNFNSVSSGSPLPKIPTDPTNSSSTGLYYTYVTDGVGNFELTSLLESSKYRSTMSKDGGPNNLRYEAGNSLTLAPPYGTVSMLHFDGTNGSTIFTDEVGTTWTAVGGTSISTAQSKFGGASGYFAGYYSEAPHNTNFNLGSNNFTVDFWQNFNSTSGLPVFFNIGDTNSGGAPLLIYWGSNVLYAGYYPSGLSVTVILSGTYNASTGNWHHIELDRSGSNWYLFLDGTSIATTTNSVTLPTTTAPTQIGIQRSGGIYSNPYYGYIDEFRLSNGVARHTANFTPPTAAYAFPYFP